MAMHKEHLPNNKTCPKLTWHDKGQYFVSTTPLVESRLESGTLISLRLDARI